MNEGEDPAGRRQAGEPPGARGDPRAAGPGARPRRVGRRGAASPAPRRVRRDPARRPDAGHGRLPDRGADQEARAHAAHTDRLPDRDLQGRRARLPGLWSRRGRLPDEAVRPAHPAGEGLRVHRPLAEDGRDQAAGRVAQGAGDRGARAGERAAISLTRRRRSADRLDDGRRREDAQLQRAVVRVHRPEARPEERGASDRPSRRCARDARAVGDVATDRRPVRGRVPISSCGRCLPLAPRPLGLPA